MQLSRLCFGLVLLVAASSVIAYGEEEFVGSDFVHEQALGTLLKGIELGEAQPHHHCPSLQLH